MNLYIGHLNRALLLQTMNQIQYLGKINVIIKL
jgi:hypothetical protein